MPDTSLSLDEIALIEKIITLQVGDLWTRRYDLGEALTDLETAQVKTLGDEMMGSAAFLIYSTESRDLTSLEQLDVDRKLKAFIDSYRNDVEIAVDPLMPLTTLTKTEQLRTNALLKWFMGESIYTAAFETRDISTLGISQRLTLSTVGS